MTTETPPTWAIGEALKRAGVTGWTVADVFDCRSYPYAQAILALATMIAKYEEPPVDPVAQVLADYHEGMGWDCTASGVLTGKYPKNITALRSALEKHGMLI